jgi:hypothetical protein
MSARAEIWLYRALALLALAGTWYCNIRFMLEGKPPLAFITDNFVTNASTNLMLDMLFVCGLLFAWIIREARRYSIPRVWIYLFFSLTIAISVFFPLFLAARRKAIAEGRKEIHGATKLTAFYPVISAVAFVVLNVFLVRFLMEGKPWTAFFTEWFLSYAGASIAIDFIILGASLLLFALSAARRGQVRKAGGAIVACVFGVAVGLPWLLREHDMNEKP